MTNIAKIRTLEVGILEDPNFTYDLLSVMLTRIGKTNLVNCDILTNIEYDEKTNTPYTLVSARIVYFEDSDKDIMADTLKFFQDVVTSCHTEEEVAEKLNKKLEEGTENTEYEKAKNLVNLVTK